MFVARWTVDVRFGHKEEFHAKLKKWIADVSTELGWKPRIVNGSIGPNESRMEMEITMDTLEALEKSWAKLARLDAHKRFGKELEPLIVSASNRWEVFRVIDL